MCDWIILRPSPARRVRGGWAIGRALGWVVAPLCAVALLVVNGSGADAGGVAGTGTASGWGTNTLPLLTTAEQVRRLPLAEAAKRYPVRLRGVITYHEPSHYLTYLQDETSAAYVGVDRGAERSAGLEKGQFVEVEGVTSPGKFAPFVEGINGHKVKVRILGRAPLPAPVELASVEYSDPRHHCQWVEMRGIVRAVDPEERAGEADRIRLELSTAHGRFRAIIPRSAGTESPVLWVDAEVRLRGVFGSIFNGKRQLIGMQLCVPDLAEVEVLAPVLVPDPFELPVRPASGLLSIRDADRPGHRVRVQGIVTMQQPGKAIFLRTDGGGLCVRTHERTVVQAGDRVDAVGFPAAGDCNPFLEDALVRVLGHESPPVAKPFDPAEGFGARQDSEWVSVDGVLLEQTSTAGHSLLIMQAGPRTFSAVLDGGSPRLPLQNNSRVRASGVCQVHADEAREPESFRLLVRSSGDVQLLQRSPWWTLQRVLWAAFALTAVSAITLAGLVRLARKNATLKREIRDRRAAEDALQQARDELESRVTRRTRQLSEANESLEKQIAERQLAEARLVAVQLQHLLERERSRIARDIHDDLGARLTQIKLLGELAERNALHPGSVAEYAQRITAAAREMTQHLDEIVWAVDPRNDTLESLLSYLCKFAQDYLGLAGVRCRLDAPASLPDRALASDVRHNLFLTFKEGLHNIVKHATATEVRIRFRPELDQFTIVIEDNGCGLTVGPGVPAPGRNGLQNMRSRMQDIGGAFRVESRAGEGTAIELSLTVVALTPPPTREELVPHTGD